MSQYNLGAPNPFQDLFSGPSQQQSSPEAPHPIISAIQQLAQQQPQQQAQPEEDYSSIRGLAPQWQPSEGDMRSPWAAISDALANIPRSQELARRDQQEQIYAQEQRKAAKEQFAVQTAQARLPMMTQMLQANPHLSSSPEMVKSFVDVYKTLGLPAPVKSDGSIDLEQLKPSYQTIDLQTQKYIDSLPPEQRKTVLDKYSAVPEEAYKNTAFITAKDQATMLRAKALGVKDEAYVKAQADRSKFMGERLRLQGLSLAERTQADQQKLAMLDARANLANAQAQRAMAEAAAIPQKLDMEHQRLQGQLQRWQDLTAKGSGGSRSAMTTALAQSRAVTSLYNQYQGKYDSLLNSLTTAQANGADETTIGALQEQIQKIKTSMDGLDESQKQVTQFITSGAGNLVTGGSITSSTGHPTEVVSAPSKSSVKPLGQAPAGITPGIYNMRGQKVEVKADGKYYPVSQ